MAPSTLRGGVAPDSGIDAALLILRVVIGVLLLFHGVGKLPPPPAVVADILAKANLPTVLAYGAYLGELVAPVLLIVGVWTRLAAVIVVVNMIAAVLLVHAGSLFKLSESGGYALELQALYLFGALALALTGAGRFSVGGRYGPMN